MGGVQIDTGGVDIPEGWQWLQGARKFHFFRKNEARSLCGGWMRFAGSSHTVADDTDVVGADDCAACTRKLGKVRIAQ